MSTPSYRTNEYARFMYGPCWRGHKLGLRHMGYKCCADCDISSALERSMASIRRDMSVGLYGNGSKTHVSPLAFKKLQDNLK